MSSDLLKEFGIPEKSASSSQAKQDVALEEEEDFGEFEVSENTKETSAASLNGIPSSMNLTFATEDATFKSSLNVPIKGDDWGAFAGESVLFDADQAMAIEDSRSGEVNVLSDQAEKPKKVSLLPIDQRNAILRSARTVPQHVPDQYDYGQDETWEPVDIPHVPVILANASPPLMSTRTADPGSLQITESKDTSKGPIPSNLPPPSILLPLLASHFQSLSIAIKRFASSQSLSSEQSDKSHLDQIQAVLAIARSGARILAGRKLRWRRDNLLSQSMKIGPAGGKASGMKLAGLDKSESRREDQEAAEVLRLWRKQVGPLRSNLSTIRGQRPASSLTLPDLSENMPIRTMKQSEGAVTAPKACFLCGVKRDERVAKVDVDVEDSFGEWWCEHWGHVDCVAFWGNSESLLPQR